MNVCQIPHDISQEPFEEIFEAMQTDKYWINFFVRPCCPAPPLEQASKSLEKRREEVRSRNDFTEDQKSQLLAIIDSREEWYASSPFCRG